MAQIIDLGKIRFNWAGTYSASTEYSYNDLVKYGPNLYAFTATAAATGVLPTNTGSWALVTEGIDYRGTYTSGTLYYVNDIVIDGTNTYITLTQHTASTSVALGNANLEIIALGQEGLPNQTGNVNKVLTTDGTETEWSATTFLTKNYVGNSQGQGAFNFETAAELTDVVSAFSTATQDFAQLALVNTSNGVNASTDFIAYTAEGTNDSGWIDMGITSDDFSAATFGITGPHDGYIFMSAPRTTNFDVVSTSIAGGFATLTTGVAHGFTTGDVVRVEEVGANFDGIKTVTTAPTPTTFRFVSSAAPQSLVNLDPFGVTYKPSGDGNLVLATDETGLINSIVFAAGGFNSGRTQMQIFPDQTVHVEIATASTSPTTGAFTVAGGVGVTGNTNIAGNLGVQGTASTTGTIYGGTGAAAFENSADLTDAVAVYNITGGANSFAQFAIRNATPTSSTDLIAYMDTGDDSEGWIGMGIAGSDFDDEVYGITGSGDGYIFHNAIASSGDAGNLVFATGANGTENKIIFAAGGFDSGATQMEITPSVNVHIEIPTQSTSPTTGAFTVVGGVGIQGDLNIQGSVTFGGEGTQLVSENIAVNAPFIFTGADSTSLINDLGLIAEGKYTLSGLIPARKVVAKSIIDNVATLTTELNHEFLVEDSVAVANVDGTFDGTYTITSKTNTTFSYAKTAGNLSNTRINDVSYNVNNKVLSGEVATLTTATNHDYVIGEFVTVTGVDSTFNGVYTIIAPVTASTFSYSKPNASNVTSTAVTPVGTAVVNRSTATGTVANPVRTRYNSWAKDATDEVWKLASNIITEPETTINYEQAGLIFDGIKVGSIALASGPTIEEFSTDITLGGASPSNNVLPTETAIKTYVDNILGNTVSISLTASNYTASYSVTVITATSAVEHRSIVLPSALNAVVGSAKFQVHNKTSFVIGIRDNTEYLLTAIEPGGSALVALTDNATVAGEWAISGTKLLPFFISNKVIVPNADATTTVNNPATNPILSVEMTSTIDLNVHTNAAGTISAFAVDYSTTPATVSTTPLIFNTGSNYTVISVKRISATRAAVFTLTDVILLAVSGTTVTLITNTNTAYSSPVRNGTTTASLEAVLHLQDDLYGVMFGNAAATAPILTVIKFDEGVIRTATLTLTQTNAVVNGWDAIATSSTEILMAFGDSATTAGVAPWAVRFTRISVAKNAPGINPSASASSTVVTPTNIASAAAYSIFLSKDETNPNKVCAIVGNSTAATINAYILTGATTGTISLGSVFTIDTAATLFVATNFGQTPLTKALQNVGADTWRFTYQGASNFMRVARITANGNNGSVTLPTYHGKNPASNITTLGPNFNNDVVIMSTHGQPTTSYSGVLAYVNTNGAFEFTEFTPPENSILFTTIRTYNHWTTDGWVLATGAQSSAATTVLVQHNQYAIYKVSDKGIVTYYGTYGLPINSNIGTVFNPQAALAGRIKDAFSSTFYDVAKNIPYRIAVNIEFIKV